MKGSMAGEEMKKTAAVTFSISSRPYAGHEAFEDRASYWIHRSSLSVEHECNPIFLDESRWRRLAPGGP